MDQNKAEVWIGQHDLAVATQKNYYMEAMVKQC